MLALRLRELRNSGKLHRLASVQLLSLQGRAYIDFIDQQLLALPQQQLAAMADEEVERRIMSQLAERVALDSTQRMTSLFLEAVNGCKARCRPEGRTQG